MTEFALFLPLMVLLAIVPLELAAMTFLKQSIHVGAYEGARLATKKLGTESEAVARCQQIMEERGIAEWEIGIEPDLDSVNPGDIVTVTVSANYGANAAVGLFYTDTVLTSSVSMMRE